MQELYIENNRLIDTLPKLPFISNVVVDSISLRTAIQFSLDMTFLKKGKCISTYHRSHVNKNIAVQACNILQGKLGEFAAYHFLERRPHISTSKPNCECYPIGKSDIEDLQIQCFNNGNLKQISIKTIKHYARLFLTPKDKYSANEELLDYYILVRIKNFEDYKVANLLKTINTDNIFNTLTKEQLQYQIVGYINKKQYIKYLETSHLPKGTFIGNTPLLTDNIMIHSNFFKKFNQI